MQEIFTVQEAARFLNVSETVMYRLLRNGTIRGRKVGHIWRVRKQDILDFFDSQSNNIRTRSCPDAERSDV